MCQHHFQEEASTGPVNGLLRTRERAAPRTWRVREGTPEYLAHEGQVSDRLPHAAAQNDHLAVTAPLGPERRARGDAEAGTRVSRETWGRSARVSDEHRAAAGCTAHCARLPGTARGTLLQLLPENRLLGRGRGASVLCRTLGDKERKLSSHGWTWGWEKRRRNLGHTCHFQSTCEPRTYKRHLRSTCEP